MKKKLFAIIISNFILFHLSAQSQDSGDFLSEIDAKILSLPGSGTNVFVEPTNLEMTDWDAAILAIHNGQYTQAHNILLGIGYQLVEYTDSVKGGVYYMAEKQSGSSNYWGTYIFNANPIRQRLVIQAPHPDFDTNSGSQASYVFRETGARALFISGTERCNSSNTASNCSGTTTTCGGGSAAYRISDNPHNTETAFHSATEVLFNAISNSIFVQLHGFGKKTTDPYVILSNGTDIEPIDTDYLAEIRDELMIEDPVLTFKIAHLDSWTRLTGSSNVQGRLINSASDPCLDDSPTNNSRFIHIEQERYRLREDLAGWIKMSNALSRVFPVDVGLPQVSLLINEIHADPASDLTGDANGDLVRSASDDEFVEIVNTGISSVDLSGFKLFDEVKLRHVFADGTMLPAGKAIVVFGGGNPSGTFGNSIIQTASKGSLGITNEGDRVELQNHVGEVIDTYTYSIEGSNNQSINRSPDLDEGTMSLHSSIPASNGTLYSPGTQLNGSAFEAPIIDLIINEIHADPASDISGDANGDGVRSSSDDEFIEIVNLGDKAIDISGFEIYDYNSSFKLRHTFYSGTIVPAGEAIVIFGGGTPNVGSFGGSVVQTASSGALGVTNTNETIEIRDLEGNVLDVYSYTSEAEINQSLTRSPDLVLGSMSAHSSVANGVLYSPGTKLDGAIFRSCTTIDEESFESGWGIWNDGGSDAQWNNSSTYAQSGTYSIRLRDNSNSSIVTTDDLTGASSYEVLQVSFSYFTNSMDNSNEDFWLQVSTDGGNSFTTVAEWNLDDEFVNDNRYNETVEIDGILFTNQTQLRFRCDASGNSDFVYLDDILIEGCGTSGNANRVIQVVEEVDGLSQEALGEFVVYPNPAQEFLYFEISDAVGHSAQVRLLNLGGQVIKQENYIDIQGTRIQMSLSEVPNGIYLIQFEVDGLVNQTRKIVVSK